MVRLARARAVGAAGEAREDVAAERLVRGERDDALRDRAHDVEAEALPEPADAVGAERLGEGVAEARVPELAAAVEL